MPSRYFADTSALIARLLRRTTGYAWMEHLCGPSAGNTVAIAEIKEW
jgi:hypothetical protein